MGLATGELATGEEWAVLGINIAHRERGWRFAGPGFGAAWTTEEAARAHYARLVGVLREQAKARADEEEAAGFPDGNSAYYSWHNEWSGRKHIRYALVRRFSTPFTIVEQEAHV